MGKTILIDNNPHNLLVDGQLDIVIKRQFTKIPKAKGVKKVNRKGKKMT